LHGEDPIVPPPTTMLGALYRYLREADPKHFQADERELRPRRRLGGAGDATSARSASSSPSARWPRWSDGQGGSREGQRGEVLEKRETWIIMPPPRSSSLTPRATPLAP
jgi:hypothetical protein